MPPRDSVDLKTRQRIAANLRLLKHRLEIESDAALARRIGASRSVVNRALKADRTVGLDFVLKVHRGLHVSMDWLVDVDPDEEWFDPEYGGPHRT